VVSELRDRDSVHIEGDLLFAGYLIQAPEYKWDDLKETNFKDKIIVSLVNDPDLKTSGFGNESLTYYGRWTYKFEMARKLKAKGILLIHHNREATYGWNIVETSLRSERLHFKDKNPHPLACTGWISQKAINKILAERNLNYDKLKKMAEKRTFKPFSLKTKISLSFKQKYRIVESANIIGIIPGTDPILKDEAVIFTGHFDHLGIGKPDKTGDVIYNGAVDNASGISALICLARAFVNDPIQPKRTVIFMPVTAEELGLLGSLWYVQHPIVPLEKTAIVINKDCMNHLGKRAGFAAFPVEYSTALNEVGKIGASLGLNLIKHTKDIGGGAFRSDHFPFASRGVPALSVRLAGKNISISTSEEKKIKKSIGNTYHRPNDEVHPLWRYDGVIQELQLLYLLGRHWADGAAKPKLKMEGNNPYMATMRWYGIKVK